MSFSVKQYFNFPTLRERVSWCCFNLADAEQLEKGNKQLGEILPLFMLLLKKAGHQLLRGWGKAKVGTGNADSD